MRTLEQQLSYEQLELIASSSANSSTVAQPSREKRTWTKSAPMLERTTALFRRMASAAIYRLTHPQEPRIWTSTVKSGPHMGQTLWHLYDPMTRQRATLFSEAEVRSWLETRYSR